jgi:predicted ATPase/DNA-binding winged helix-turn-helix (wHTH) protein
MVGPPTRPRDVISFGRFALVPIERLLTEDDVPLDLGARTLDTLIALVSRPNEVISKRELMALIWPDAIVEESSLRFHIASLRKALGDGKDGARFIATLAGRGYCFVAPITRYGDRNVAAADGFLRATFLPARLARVVGREESVRIVSAELAASRFVTIVGHGGIGKTTVAAAVAHDLLAAFDNAVLFVDFGMLSDPKMVPTSVASMLGISIQSEDPLPSLGAHLRDKRMLVILDNCEHVVEAAARLAAHIFLTAPHLHILTTSREALRVEGEHVHRLPPLGVPPDDQALTAAMALTYPATQLFMERVAASGVRGELTDEDAAIVASICRKLDGVALAIELAAGRVEAYGLRQTAALLDQRLTLLWPGQRTAPPRQKTLQATLDWSYRLLSGSERVVFRHLAVFVGAFTIDAALAVVTSTTINEQQVFEAIDSLVAKSMIATRPAGAMMRYRLLDTARSYALESSFDDAERTELAARHATYCRRWLDQAGAGWPTLSDAAERAPYLVGLNNVRAALEWCFGPHGDAESGVGLAAAAAPLFLALSLLTDCLRWSERAIRSLGDAAPLGPETMHLQAALGLSLMFTGGDSDAACKALARSLTIAEERADLPYQLRTLGRLHMFHHRMGEFRKALSYAERSYAVAKSIASPESIALARCELGISFSYLGDLDGARSELEATLQYDAGSQRSSTIFHGFDHYNITGAYLARTLWLQGYPDQALQRARLTARDAADHPVTLSIALLWVISVFLWTGDLESAEEHTHRLIAHAERHSLGPYLAAGRGFEGELAIRRGDAEDGVVRLLDCLEALEATRFRLLTAAFSVACVQGLAAMGRFAEGAAQIDKTLIQIEVNGGLSLMPEVLRAKGNILLAMPQVSIDEAVLCLERSLALSRRQRAGAWELRTATDLAALWAGRGQSAKARALLRPVFERFTEGANTADLQAATRLLSNWH